jgi:hypothetical protein
VTPIFRLEQYSLKHPQEVLLVKAAVNGIPDEIMIFKGFSSSLVHPTAFDPDIPVLPAHAEIIQIDLAYSPYNPDAPHYIQQGLTWDMMQSLLKEVGI